MQATTVNAIVPVIEETAGLSWECDRAEILSIINQARSLMFSGLGNAARDAFFLRKDCVPIHKYTHDCRTGCRAEYWGFSLPADVVAASVFRMNGERLDVTARWGKPLDSWNCDCCPEALDLGKGWPLPEDPPEPADIGFRLSETGDCGACEDSKEPGKVGVSYRDLNGTHQREDIELSTDEVRYTSHTVKSLERKGLTFPPGRTGYLEVWANGEQIAEFHPSVDVPDHRRFAISGRGCACTGTVEIDDSLHCPERVFFGTDTVETGDPVFWQNLVQFLDLHAKTKRSPSEERSYASVTAMLASQAEQALDAMEPDGILPVIEPDEQFVSSIYCFRERRRRIPRAAGRCAGRAGRRFTRW